MPPPDTRPESVRAALRFEAGATSVVFTWKGDRWTHRIETVGPGGSTVWESVEGPLTPGDDPRWPASPALVELSRVVVAPRDGAGGSALVGVGLAGRSHFSASIAADASAADALRFEIACRVQEAPIWLGSTYRRGGELLRLAAADIPGSKTRTVVWSYSIGPQGLFHVTAAVPVEARP